MPVFTKEHEPESVPTSAPTPGKKEIDPTLSILAGFQKQNDGYSNLFKLLCLFEGFVPFQGTSKQRKSRKRSQKQNCTICAKKCLKKKLIKYLKNGMFDFL